MAAKQNDSAGGNSRHFYLYHQSALFACIIFYYIAVMLCLPLSSSFVLSCRISCFPPLLLIFSFFQLLLPSLQTLFIYIIKCIAVKHSPNFHMIPSFHASITYSYAD